MDSTTGADFVIAKELLEEIDDDKEEVGDAGFVAIAGALVSSVVATGGAE